VLWAIKTARRCPPPGAPPLPPAAALLRIDVDEKITDTPSRLTLIRLIYHQSSADTIDARHILVDYACRTYTATINITRPRATIVRAAAKCACSSRNGVRCPPASCSRRSSP